jgi:tetratricopeptide (TPR) repeat protein
MVYSLVISAQTSATEWFDAGNKLFENKNYKEAVASFEKASTINPKYYAAFYKAGWCYNDLDMYEMAVDRLKKAVELKPDYHLAFQELGYAYKKLGKNEEALVSLKRAVEIKPTYVSALKQLGDVYQNLKNKPEAINAYTKCYENDKQNSDACYNLGYIYNGLEDFTKALEWLNICVQIEPDTDAYNEMGFSYYKLIKNEESIAAYNNAIKINPKNGISYKGIGDVYRRNYKPAKIAEAIESYKKAIEFNPKSSGSHYGLGWCYNENKAYEEAIPILKKSIELDKTLVVSYSEVGYALYMTGKNTDGLYYLQQGLLQDNKNALCRYYSGLIYIVLKDKIKATVMYNELKPIDSKLAEKLLVKINVL